MGTESLPPIIKEGPAEGGLGILHRRGSQACDFLPDTVRRCPRLCQRPQGPDRLTRSAVPASLILCLQPVSLPPSELLRTSGFCLELPGVGLQSGTGPSPLPLERTRRLLACPGGAAAFPRAGKPASSQAPPDPLLQSFHLRGGPCKSSKTHSASGLREGSPFPSPTATSCFQKQAFHPGCFNGLMFAPLSIGPMEMGLVCLLPGSS